MGSITQPIGTVIGAGINAASQVGTNATNIAIANKNNQTQREIAEANNQMQVDMNRENNQFSHDEAELAYQRDIEQFNRENAYNTPVEQLKRFQEAGINPTLGLLGNAAMPAASSSAAPMAQPHGSGITPSMPQFHNPAVNPIDIGSAVKAFAEARIAGVESKTMEAAFDSIVKKYQEDARYQEMQADIAEVQDFLVTAYGKQRYQAETNEILERTFQLTAQAFLFAKEGELADAQKQKELALEEVYKLDRHYKQKEVDSFDKFMSARIDNLNASSQESRAAAEKFHAEAITEDTLRNLRKDLLGSEADLRSVDAETEKALFSNGMLYSERINQIQKLAAERREAQISRDQAEELYPIIVATAEQDRRKGNVKDWEYYVDKTLGALMNSAGAAVGAYAGAKGGRPTPKPIPVSLGYGK